MIFQILDFTVDSDKQFFPVERFVRFQRTDSRNQVFIRTAFRIDQKKIISWFKRKFFFKVMKAMITTLCLKAQVPFLFDRKNADPDLRNRSCERKRKEIFPGAFLVKKYNVHFTGLLILNSVLRLTLCWASVHSTPSPQLLSSFVSP